MRYLLIVIFLISPGLFAAQEPKRPSSFLFSGTSGPESYQSYLLDTKIALGTEWSVSVSYFKSDSGIAILLNEPLVSKEIRADVDWQINTTWGGAIGVISRQDPYEIIGKGAFLTGRANINDWWKGKKQSTLTLSYESLLITQDLLLQGKFVNFNIQKDLIQKNTRINFNQELFDWLSISLNHQKYSYSEKTNDLVLTTSKRRTTWGGSSASYGYPEFINGLELQIAPIHWLELRLGASQTKTLGNDLKTRSSSAGASFFWEKFQVDLDYSRTDYGSTSGSSEQVQNYSSIAFGYNW